MLRDTDWAYLAGIIDGEGTMGVYRRQPRVVVAMCTEQPVLWIHETFGGRLKLARRVRNPDAREGLEIRYTWGVYSRAYVWEILDGCLPYLILKRKKAEEVMPACV